MFLFYFFYVYVDHRDLHVLTHSLPTRRSSDLLAGVAIGWNRDPMRIESIRDALAAEKRWGQKTKAGFYDYDDKRNPSPSPRVAEIIEDFRKKTGAKQHEVTSEENVERTLYPMVNEAALAHAEGQAQGETDGANKERGG